MLPSGRASGISRNMADPGIGHRCMDGEISEMHRPINVLSQDYLFYESWEYISKQYKEEGHR